MARRLLLRCCTSISMSSLALLCLSPVSDIAHGGDPANYFAVIVLLRHIHDVNGTYGGVLIRNVPSVFDPITLKNLFNVWKHRLEGFVADDLRDGFSDYVFGTKTKHLAVRFADEPIT